MIPPMTPFSSLQVKTNLPPSDTGIVSFHHVGQAGVVAHSPVSSRVARASQKGFAVVTDILRRVGFGVRIGFVREFEESSPPLDWRHSRPIAPVERSVHGRDR